MRNGLSTNFRHLCTRAAVAKSRWTGQGKGLPSGSHHRDCPSDSSSVLPESGQCCGVRGLGTMKLQGWGGPDWLPAAALRSQ